jgi:hypothetical protein
MTRHQDSEPAAGEKAPGASGDPSLAAAANLLANPLLFELFVTKVVQQVDAHVRERQSHTQQRTGWIVGGITAMVALVSGAVISYFNTIIDSHFAAQKATIEQELTKSITETVAANAQAQMTNQLDAFAAKSNRYFTSESLFLEFVVAVNTIDVKQSSDLAEIKTVVDLLHRIAALDELQSRADFERLLVTAFDKLDSFGDQGVDRYIDEVEPKFRDRLRGNAGATQTMLEHYFRELMASPDAPNDWNPAAMERFELYADAAVFHNKMGGTAAMRMIKAFAASGLQADAVIDNMIMEANGLDGGERDRLLETCKRYANQDWSKLIANRVTKFDSLYWNQLPPGSQKATTDTAATP